VACVARELNCLPDVMPIMAMRRMNRGAVVAFVKPWPSRNELNEVMMIRYCCVRMWESLATEGRVVGFESWLVVVVVVVVVGNS
jgi:hypothetical protein